MSNAFISEDFDISFAVFIKLFFFVLFELFEIDSVMWRRVTWFSNTLSIDEDMCMSGQGHGRFWIEYHREDQINCASSMFQVQCQIYKTVTLNRAFLE